jgi:hypothetical protein
MEAVCERGNLMLAYQRVVRNKGAAGVDGIGVTGFKDHLKRHWPTIKAKLLAGMYLPQAVRRVDIPKPQGGVRTLGIPTLTDRLIQQALHQVLSPLCEADFSGSSYGFRPGRNAHQVVQAAQRYVGEGLEVGMMADGVISPRTQGTPQGGPLSPLLSNILLTELDRELERRGHAFYRYADDCNIYVRSQAAGERVLANITRFLAERLKLRGGRSLRHTIAELNPVLRDWAAYFRLTETRGALEELDGWLRHKLRCILWRQWKRPYTRTRNLMQAGLMEERAFRSAFNQRGPWWNSGASHMNQAFRKSFFDRLGLVSLLDTTRRFQCLS